MQKVSVSDSSVLMNLAFIDRLMGVLMKEELDIESEMDRLRDSGFYISDELYSKVLEQSGD